MNTDFEKLINGDKKEDSFNNKEDKIVNADKTESKTITRNDDKSSDATIKPNTNIKFTINTTNEKQQDEKPVKIKEDTQNINTNSDNTNTSSKEKDEQAEIDNLFKISETKKEYKDVWINVYKEAKESKKSNYIVDKCKRGRFIIIDGKPVILPELDIYGKSSKDIMNIHWI